MDPVSAVGLAAAIAQFLEISVKAVALCIRIRDAEASGTELYQELGDHLRQVKASRNELTTGRPGSVPRRISDLANKCTDIASELLKLFEHISGLKPKVGTATKVFRVLKERKTIEKLLNSLKEKEKALDSVLVQDLW
jgi:uncharacterized protein Yka (UPF0111/DUF47 family)